MSNLIQTKVKGKLWNWQFYKLKVIENELKKKLKFKNLRNNKIFVLLLMKKKINKQIQNFSNVMKELFRIIINLYLLMNGLIV